MTRLMFVLACLLMSLPALADERILSFHSDIQVFRDGGMSVTETIRVRAEGKQIKRGIYRDFPTTYRDVMGNRYVVDFELLGVERDGRSEAHHTQSIQNGIRIYIGRKNVQLKPGIYTYKLHYRTRRQLGFFDQHDELYWNVTGNDWAFPIDQASASVQLPQGVPDSTVRLEAYTGPEGAQGRDYLAMTDEYGVHRFEATRSLSGREGITIVVGWPKGYVTEPDVQQIVSETLKDNRHLFIGLCVMVVLLLYYLAAWYRVGRDPRTGVIVTLYEPPKGFSPASMRFIRNMGHDNKTFAAALINLAIKGYIQINESYKRFTLKKLPLDNQPRMAPGEKALINKLFRSGNTLKLEKTNHKQIREAKKAHEESLSNDYERLYFNTNRMWLLPGIIITIFVLMLIVVFSPGGEQRMILLFMMVWLSIWSFGTFALILAAVHAWKAVAHNGIVGVVGAVVTTLFSIPFFGGWCMGVWMLSESSSWTTVILLVAPLGINVMFYQLLKAPTRAGRQLLDQVEGFREYLRVAETDSLNHHHPAGKTVATFEKYLPYALALDVEQAWAEEFAEVLVTAQTLSGGAYHPTWYHGDHFSLSDPSAFSIGLGSAFASSIGSASSAPGSSSGGGGGGSSGGGGGGGGGGGW